MYKPFFINSYQNFFNGDFPDQDNSYLDDFQHFVLNHTDYRSRRVALFTESPQLKAYYTLRSIHIHALKAIVFIAYEKSKGKKLLPVRFKWLFKGDFEPGFIKTFHRISLEQLRSFALECNTCLPFESNDLRCYTSLHSSSGYRFDSERKQSEIVTGDVSLDLDYLKKQDRDFANLLEMAPLVPPDQIVRALSLFLSRYKSLNTEKGRRDFETLVLSPRCIRAAFKDRPELIYELGSQFHLLFRKLHSQKNSIPSLFIASEAEEFIFLCTEVAPDIRLHFPNFRQLVRTEYLASDRNAKIVLAAMYLNVDRQTESLEVQDEVVSALKGAIPHLKRVNQSTKEFMSEMETRVYEVYWSWKPFIEFSEEELSFEKTPLSSESAPKDPEKPNQVDLSQVSHRLHLLEWFQPLSDLTVFEKDGWVLHIECKKLNLKFSVRLHNEERRAYCDEKKLNEFWIATIQKDARLRNYPNSLLLESDKGENRLLIPVYSRTTIFQETALHTFKKIHSPLIEKLLGAVEPGEKFYAYQFNEKGGLDSMEPEALAYLTLLDIVKNDTELTTILFNKFIRLGKQKFFNTDAVSYIHSMIIFLFVSRNPKFSQFFLRLIAMMEENRLIQGPVKLSKSVEAFSSGIKYLMLAIVHAKYSNYLEDNQSYLSEYEELFIFKFIVSNTPIPSALKAVSSIFSNLAMQPLLGKRYQLLRRKHLRQESFIQNYTEHAFLHALIGETSSIESAEPNLTSSGSASSSSDRIISNSTLVVQKILALSRHPLVGPDLRSLQQEMSFAGKDSFNPENWTIGRLTNQVIYQDFISIYKLFYEKEPGTYEEIGRSINLVRGTNRNKKNALLLYVLQTVANSSNPKRYFPTPKALLEDRHAPRSLIRTCAAINAVGGISSFVMERISRPIDFIPRDLSFLIPTPVRMAYSGLKALIGVTRAIRSFPDLPSEAEPVSMLDAPLGDDIMERLVQRESEIDEQLTLSGGEPFSSCPKRPFQYQYDPLDPLSLRREIEKLNESIVEYAHKPKYSDSSHSCTRTREEVKRELLFAKEELEALTGLSFDAIETSFLYGDDTKWDRETLIKIYLYKISSSRWNAYFERGAVRRAYKFNDLPEKGLRALLTFEEKAKTLLWTKQYGPLKRLIIEGSPRHVCEMIMGLRKTDVVMPIANQIRANGAVLVINIRPQAIFKSALAKSPVRNYQIFSQETNTIPLTRSGWTLERLEALYIKLQQVCSSREVWDGVKEELQSLELTFIEEVLDIQEVFASAEKKEWKERICLYKLILGYIRTKGKGEVDEVHTEFERKNELNFPLGSSKALKLEHAEVIADIVLELLATPELAAHINLRGDAPTRVDRLVYETEILPILIFKLSRGDPKVANYLQNRAPLYRPNPKLALIKGVLNNLLPSILQEVLHVNYGSLKKESSEFAIPSGGNENPQERSTFKNQFAAFLKTILLLVHDRLNPEQIEKFINHLKHRAELELKGIDANVEDLNRTKEARYFRENCPDFDLFSFGEEDRVEVYKRLNESDQFVLDYACIFIRKQIRYYSYSVSSNAHNFSAMFKGFSGYTASTYNKGTYPQATQILYDIGTQGETATLLHERRSPCYVLEESKPEEVLEEILTTFFENDTLHYRAIIDRGAVFNGMTNERVARGVLEYLTRERVDLLGVVFYNKEKELCVWEKGKESPSLLSESLISPENRVTYFDQSHTYAADILQAHRAKALVTVGEQNIAEDIFQAVWRMRGLKTKDQDLTFVMTRNVKMIVSGDNPPTIDAIIQFGIREQARKSEENNYYSDLALLSNIVRRAVLDKALGASSVEDTIGIIRDFRSLFLGQNSGDPIVFFDGLDELAEPLEMLEKTKERLMDLIISESLFSYEEIESIRQQLERIGYQAYPSVVMKRDTSAIEQLFVDEETNQDEEEIEEVEIVQSLEQTLENSLEKRSPLGHKTWAIFDFKALVEQANHLIPFSSSRFSLLTFFSIRRILSVHNLEELKVLARFIDPRILATNNLMPYPTAAFDYFQIPVLEALIVEDEGQIRNLILFTAEDAAEWRKILPSYDKKFALIDIGTQLIVSESPDQINRELFASLEFQLMLLQIRFLSGEVNFLETDLPLLGDWLRTLPFRPIQSFVMQPHKAQKYSNSSLQNLMYLIEREKIRSTRTAIRC